MEYWILLFLGLVTLVLVILVLVRVNKKSCNSGKEKMTRRIKSNNPVIIKQMAQKYCNSNVSQATAINNFTTVMNMENNCQESLWNDGDSPGYTDDDNVMMYLCNYNGTASSIAQQYPSQTQSIDCALTSSDSSNCC